MSNILNLKTGEPFDPLPRLHHREESPLQVSSSELSVRARGMLLGAKSFYIGGAKKYTARDYQGNFAALWHGVENAGYGIHSNTITKWVDLANPTKSGTGFGLTSSCEWADDGLIFNGAISIGGTNNNFYFGRELSDNPPAHATFEYCVKVDSLVQNAGHVIRWKISNMGPIRAMNPWGFYRLTSSDNGSYGKEVSDAYNLLPYIGKNFYKTITFTAGDGKLYIDGSYAKTIGTRLSNTEGFAFCVGSMGQTAKICSVRVSLEDLTPDQIAHNAEVDNSIFELY